MTRFTELLALIVDGMTVTLTARECEDIFQIFSSPSDSVRIAIHATSAPYWVEFNGDDPMLLENCPEEFYTALISNIEAGNYTIS